MIISSSTLTNLVNSHKHKLKRLSLIRLCSVFLLTLGAGFSSAHVSNALPLETFTTPFKLNCAANTAHCSGVLRHERSLAKHTGIAVQKGAADGGLELEVDRDDSLLSFSGSDISELILTLSWDGDSNPGVLSGSGLNCFDLTRNHAYAFIIPKFSLKGSCEDADGFRAGCPSFTIESRVYDARDPTGQRFSSSVLTRQALSGSDVVVPFSNFLRSGPRGKGSFNCAGAITLTLRFSAFSELKGSFGAIYTNGDEGIEPIPTPTLGITSTVSGIPTAPVALAGPVQEIKQGNISQEQGALNTTKEHKHVEAKVDLAKVPVSERKAAKINARNTAVVEIREAVEEEAHVTYGQVVK